MDINDARPASDVSRPSACVRYPRLTQNPNSIPALRIRASSHDCKANGKNGMAETTNLTAVKVAGSITASISFTTGILLAAI